MGDDLYIFASARNLSLHLYFSHSRITFGQGLQEVPSFRAQIPSPLPPASHSPQVKYFFSSLLGARQPQAHSQVFSLTIPSLSFLDVLSAFHLPVFPKWGTPHQSGNFPTFRSMCFSVFCSVTEVNKLCAGPMVASLGNRSSCMATELSGSSGGQKLGSLGICLQTASSRGSHS